MPDDRAERHASEGAGGGGGGGGNLAHARKAKGYHGALVRRVRARA